MANEVYVSSQGDTLATQVFIKELELLLHQKPFMRDLCVYKGDTKGIGSDTLKVGEIDVDDIAETVAEGSAITGNTAITDASFTLVPARRAIKRTLSDKLAIVDSTGMMNEVMLANYNFSAVMKAFDALVATAITGFTGTVGTSGVDMSATDWFSAQQTLNTRRAEGRTIFLGHTVQFNDLQSSLRTEVGPWQLRQDVQDMLGIKGANFKGFLNGIEIWNSDQIVTANAGADRSGAMFIFGGLAYAEGSPDPVTLGGGRIMAPGGTVYTSVDLDGDKAEVAIITNYFCAVSVSEADKGVKVITDA
jgi:multisubunit Na+/H+ antiporter MnhF subunit